MLEQMRQKGASIFIYLIFGLLIVIFVINFAPQGGRGEGGCRGVSNTVIDVNGSSANTNAWHIAYKSLSEGRDRTKVYRALDTLIKRELLADAGRAAGLRTTRDMVEDEIKQGYFFVGGQRIALGENIFDMHEGGKRTWSIGKFRGWVQYLDVSQNAYLEEQVRGLQATLMAEMMAASAQVSREEALTEWLFDHTTISYDAVTFSPSAYRDAMLLTDADVERFLAKHEDQVKAKHKEREREFTDRKPELKLRKIFIAKAEPAAAPPAEEPKKDDKKKDDAKKDDAKKDDAKKDDAKAAGAAAKPAGLPIEEAKAKLEAARTQAAGNKATFIELAQQLNTDPVARASGGNVGWKPADNASLGEKVVSDAVKALKTGEMTPVIATDKGVYLVLVEDQREKNLTYDQVKVEIATELAREVWGKEAAKRAALQAFATARAEKQKLGDVFPRDTAPAAPMPGSQPSIQDILRDPTVPEETKRKLMDMLQRQPGKTGAITVESDNVPAAWKAGEGAGAAPGSAGSAAGAGSAAPAAGTPAPAPPAAPAPLVASDDVLPQFHSVPPAKVRTEGPTPRQKKLPGLDEAAVKTLFDEAKPGDLLDRVVEGDLGYTLVQLVDKPAVDTKEFDKDADRIIENIRALRGMTLVNDWVKARCEELAAAGKIRPDPNRIRETDDKGNEIQPIYKPCMTLR